MYVKRIALLIPLFLLLLYSCNQAVENTGPPQIVSDTVAAIAEPSRQIDSLKDLSSFKIDADYLDMDEHITAFMARPTVKETDISNEYCRGDACYRYKCLRDTAGDEYMYIVKHDEGEYGFGNDQYFFAGDKLRLVRSFTHELINREDEQVAFTTTEYMCIIGADKNIGYARSIETDGDYSLDGVNFIETAIDAEEAEESWRERLREYFAIEIEAKKEDVD